MMCQKCGQNVANTHLTKIINGVKQEYYLCEKCAGMKPDPIQTLNFDVDITNFLSSIFAGADAPQTVLTPENLCSSCGTSFGEFSQTSKLGCCDCYRSFAHRLSSPLKKLHAAGEHTGKIPLRLGSEVSLKREIRNLEIELSGCIEQQNFERAAEIRDKLNDLRDGKK